MKKQDLEAFAREVAKGLKTEQDLNEFSQMLTKVTVEAALNAELEDHLGYARHEPSENANSRNGYGSKRLSTGEGEFELETPRDRDGSFEPKLVKKGQRCFTVPEQRDPQGHQEAQAVPVGRFGPEGGVPGDYGCVKKMDHADPELEGGAEPVYH